MWASALHNCLFGTNRGHPSWSCSSASKHAKATNFSAMSPLSAGCRLNSQILICRFLRQLLEYPNSFQAVGHQFTHHQLCSFACRLNSQIPNSKSRQMVSSSFIHDCALLHADGIRTFQIPNPSAICFFSCISAGLTFNVLAYASKRAHPKYTYTPYERVATTQIPLVSPN